MPAYTTISMPTAVADHSWQQLNTDAANTHGVFLSVSNNGGSNPTRLAISTLASEGATWSNATISGLSGASGTVSGAFGMATHGTDIMLADANGTVAVSNNLGGTWRREATGLPFQADRIDHANGLFIIMHNSGVLTSPGGAAGFTTQYNTETVFDYPDGFCFVGGTYFFLGSRYVVLTDTWDLFVARTTNFTTWNYADLLLPGGSAFDMYAYGSELSVFATAADGTVKFLTSTDGITWVNRALPPLLFPVYSPPQSRCFAFGSRVVGVSGDAPGLLFTDDNRTWALASFALTGSASTKIGSRLIHAEYNATSVFSVDVSLLTAGVIAPPPVLASSSSILLPSHVANDTWKYVAVGDRLAVVLSDRYQPYDDSIYIAVADLDNGYDNWTTVEITGITSPAGVRTLAGGATHGSTIMILDASGAAVTALMSQDVGATWTRAALTGGQYPQLGAYLNGRFIVAHGYNVSSSTNNGVSFAENTDNAPDVFQGDKEYFNGRYYFAGNGPDAVVHHSANLSSWTTKTFGVNGYCVGLCVLNGQLLAAVEYLSGDKYVYATSDGTTWVARQITTAMLAPGKSIGYMAAQDGVAILSVNSGAQLLVSVNAVDWFIYNPARYMGIPENHGPYFLGFTNSQGDGYATRLNVDQMRAVATPTVGIPATTLFIDSFTDNSDRRLQGRFPEYGPQAWGAATPGHVSVENGYIRLESRNPRNEAVYMPLPGQTGLTAQNAGIYISALLTTHGDAVTVGYYDRFTGVWPYKVKLENKNGRVWLSAITYPGGENIPEYFANESLIPPLPAGRYGISITNSHLNLGIGYQLIEATYGLHVPGVLGDTATVGGERSVGGLVTQGFNQHYPFAIGLKGGASVSFVYADREGNLQLDPNFDDPYVLEKPWWTTKINTYEV